MATPQIKLTYFPLEAAAEKVRLALVMTDTPFEDVRIPFAEWQALKESGKTPYGQLPIMEVTEGGKTTIFAQSGAMMRWIARQFDATEKLYPAEASMTLAVEECLGLAEDLAAAWKPSLYLGMRHTVYGYPEDWPEKAEKVKEMREKFLAQSLPQFMGFMTKKLETGGPYFCGNDITIADLQILPQLRYFTKGVADHVPKESLAPYPVITAWMDRMHAHPKIKAWYDAHS